MVGFSWEEALQLVMRNLWRKYEWRAPNRFLVVQTGESASHAKVFKAHAALQGLCENLINALKVLAKDGDIVQPRVLWRAFAKEAEKKLCSALAVGYVKGTRSFEIRML